MKNKRIAPEVNAGSMADIAFLLLIFFLVTASIENDVGLNRMLHREDSESTVVIKKRNLMEISINSENNLMVKGEIIELKQLRKAVVAFLDNGGISEGEEGFCDYCRGKQLSDLSENPDKAIISLKTNRKSDYSFYVSVQNEIIGAYNQLRNREGQRLFGLNYEQLVSDYNTSEITEQEKQLLKERITTLRTKYPQKLVEPETISY